MNITIKFIINLILILGMCTECHCQSEKNLLEINDVWKKFSLSFESLDAKLFSDIHSQDLIRIAGGWSIRNYQEYITRYEANFEKAKRESITNSISLRFFERMNNDSIASERGIYKLTRRSKDQKEDKIYFGQFHVLLKKENDVWKIIMDYDSNEKGTIGEDDFQKAYAMDNLDVFIPK